MKKSWLYIIIILFCITLVNATNIQRYTINSIGEIKRFITPQTLFVFDIDNTILYALHDAPTNLIEPTIFPNLFNTIKRRSFGALSITARTTLHAYEIFTLEQLKHSGIFPNQFFPINNTNISCILLHDSNKAYYLDGVIFVEGTNKGVALHTFLATLPELPDTIVFVDDQAHNLDNVAATFKSDILLPSLKTIILCDYPYVANQQHVGMNNPLFA